AMGLASATGAQLELAHVVALPPEASRMEHNSEIEPALEALRTRLRERVDQAGAQLEQERARCAEKGVECQTRLIEGHPWEAIIEEAARGQADLLILGAHGAGPPRVLSNAIKERLLGTTADRVVRHAPCPVMAAAGEQPVAKLQGARWLVGVDFSPASEAAVRLASRLAEASGGQVTLAHAAAPSGLGEHDEQDANWRQVLREESRKQTERDLRELAQAESKGAEIHQGNRVSRGPAAEELAQAVKESDADFLVIGSHGKKGLSRLVLGSTAERSLRLADVPVLVVRPADLGKA
ncbi:MAG: universal stress protein, partial [Myxococcota bacterium]